jgi:hypothetical protein
MKKLESKKGMITPKWIEIKSMFKEGTNGIERYGKNFELGGEFDQKASALIDDLGDITTDLGFRAEIEGLSLDSWKERVWNLIERAGLLPEIAWRDDKDKDIVDNWKSFDGTDDFNEEKFEKEILKILNKR